MECLLTNLNGSCLYGKSCVFGCASSGQRDFSMVDCIAIFVELDQLPYIERCMVCCIHSALSVSCCKWYRKIMKNICCQTGDRIYLESVCPLFSALTPPKQGPCHSKRRNQKRMVTCLIYWWMSNGYPSLGIGYLVMGTWYIDADLMMGFWWCFAYHPLSSSTVIRTLPQSLETTLNNWRNPASPRDLLPMSIFRVDFLM